MKYSKGLVWILSSLKSSRKFLIFRGPRPKHSFRDIWNLWIRMLTDLTFSLLVVISPANINKRCKATPPPHNKTHIFFHLYPIFFIFILSSLKRWKIIKFFSTSCIIRDSIIFLTKQRLWSSENHKTNGKTLNIEHMVDWSNMAYGGSVALKTFI